MLTAIVLTKNEAATIESCLKSLTFCDAAVVVDDNSTDATVKIAKKIGAQVLTHPLDGDFAAQHNWAQEQVKSHWLLFVDADEQVPPELAAEILKSIQKVEFKGFRIPRADYIWGRQLRFGDAGGQKPLRLARRGAGEWQGRVHERWVIDGRVGTLKHALMHRPHDSLVEFLQHINQYSTIRAAEFFTAKRRTNLLEIVFGPIYIFKLNYVVKLGFLDGTAGFVHAMTMAFYMFLVASKLFLLYKGIPK